MKLSWFAVISTGLVLTATPGCAQDEATATSVDTGLEPTAGVTVEPAPAETIQPAATETTEPIPDATSEAVPGETADPAPAELTHEPVPEEGSVYEYTVEDNGYNIYPHLPENCSDIRVFSARGSNEPYPGRGGQMLTVMCALFEEAGSSCDYEDIVYPANISYSGIYCESATKGAFAGQAQMAQYVEKCPDSKLVLMGYSQGGEVVGDILGGGGGTLFGCEQAPNPSMPRNTAPGSHVAAAVSFGSPRFTANLSYDIGNGSSYNGVLARQGQQLFDLDEYEDITAMWCNHGDPVCAVGSEPVNITAHWSYYDQYSKVASEWIVATALGHTDVRLDLNLDGKNESVLLTKNSSSASSPAAPSNSSSNESKSGGGDEGVGISNKTSGGVGVLMLVALVTAGLISLS